MRCLAQRPFPSMMIAMWRGIPGTCGMSSVELGNGCMSVSVGMAAASNGHQVGFFGGEQLVDLGDGFVCELLDLILRVAFIVFGVFFFLEQVVEVVVVVAALI